MYWKYETLFRWFKKHKGHWFFKWLEDASWFKWYGKKVVYIKSKNPDNLSTTEKDIKDAVAAKDYVKALEIVNSLPVTKKTATLKQVIEAKIK